MRVKKKKYISAIFCLLGFMICIISGAFVTVNAADNASLTLNCVKDGEVITGMEWQIYHVADNSEDGKPKLTTPFQKYERKITFGDGSLSAMAQLASTLKGFTLQGKIKPTQTSVSDTEGKVEFADLEYGYYLVTATKFKQGDIAWESEPLLVVLSEEENYEVNAFPKMNYITLDATEVEYTVKKIWENDENQPQVRTTYITVEIYKDDVYDTSVRLDQSNDWTYSWTGDSAADWVVVERDVPENYVVTFRKQGVEYVIVNTYSPDGNSSSGEWTETTTTHETADQFTGSETTVTSAPQDFEELSSTTTSSTENAGSDFDTSSTSSTSTSTTTTTRTPSGSGSSSSGGSSSSSRSSSGSGSSRNSSSGTGSSSNSGSGNVASITKLPQTGQLWWPVVPLTVGGILMMGIGLKLKEKDH